MGRFYKPVMGGPAAFRHCRAQIDNGMGGMGTRCTPGCADTNEMAIFHPDGNVRAKAKKAEAEDKIKTKARKEQDQGKERQEQSSTEATEKIKAKAADEKDAKK